MHGSTRRARLAAMGLVALAAAGWTHPPAAGSEQRARPAPEEHCVIVVLDQAPDGELRTTEPVCSTSRSEALARTGSSARTADFPIGVHFDGANFTGSSVTVVGSSCTGGWLNLPASWNDRISSTSNGCPTIRHFQHIHLTPPSVTTFSPGGNLGSLSDEVSSIQYLP